MWVLQEAMAVLLLVLKYPALNLVPETGAWIIGDGEDVSMANSIITRRSVFGTALDSAASIHRNRTLQVNAGRQHLVQACIHSTPSACDARSNIAGNKGPLHQDLALS